MNASYSPQLGITVGLHITEAEARFLLEGTRHHVSQAIEKLNTARKVFKGELKA